MSAALVNADTEFADTRAAYDALDAETKARLQGLRAHRSIAYSRQTLGFEFSEEEPEKLKGAVLRSSAGSRARVAGRSTSPPTRRGSSSGRSQRDGSSCGT